MSTGSQRAQSGILDTSVFIALPDLEQADVLPYTPLITTITLAELSVGPLVATTDRDVVSRQQQLQHAEAHFVPLPFDAAAARAFGGVSASLRRVGRKRAARAFDAMIAAIALSRGLPVYTSNPGDFEGIDGLEVVAVPVPQ